MKHSFSAIISGFFFIPAVAFASGVSVTAPANGTQVAPTFTLQASSASCSSQATASMGYSLDSSSQTTTFNSTSINTTVSAGVGTHVLHVKSWGNKGAACDQDVSITIPAIAKATPTPPPPSVGPSIPSNAIAVNNIQRLSSWVSNHDAGTAGSSTGTSNLVSTPSKSGGAREYSMSYQNYGGEIFHTSFGADTSATHFVYDTWIWLDGSTTDIGNIEMDMNQVIANGETVIYGFQCDGYSSTWDYTINKGTPSAPIDAWEHSSVPCNPRNWSPNTWHHVQVAYARDSNGVVTYESVWFDGVQSNFTGATGSSAFALGWGSTLLTNFQIDGLGASGSVKAYMDNMTVYRW